MEWVTIAARSARSWRRLLCRAYKRELGRDLETVSIAPRHFGLQESQAPFILAGRQEIGGRQVSMPQPAKLVLVGEPTRVSSACVYGVVEGRRLLRLHVP